jgi:hypothetical protein
MGPHVEQLIAIASPALGEGAHNALPRGRLFTQLAELLAHRNGFYAMEGSLHVFGSGERVAGRSVETWNDRIGWRSDYRGLADNYFFFAEDVLGVQFAFLGDRVVTFDPETGDPTDFAGDLETWAAQLLREPDVLLGLPLAHEWQQTNGALDLGSRLVPKRPFVLGGEFAESNLYQADAIEGMRVRAELAVQIRDLPEGAQITYRVVN